jgi:anthranilate synthase/aminodeoxychorismate synthase-like glutamine amidotransferase
MAKATSRKPNEFKPMLLLIDNYDSFTYNLAQYFGELGCELVIKRNDEISLDEIAALAPEHICISPGPCTPREAGISKGVVLRFGAKVPILGVCLGHQCIAEAYGGKIVRASSLMHGKSSTVRNNGSGLFADLPTRFEAARYHSLVVERSSFPGCLEIIAESDDGEIMALRHREFPVYGVQFHPESVLTRDGKKILARFLALAAETAITQRSDANKEKPNALH